MLPRFVDGLAEQGTVEWVSDPPLLLRPADVDGFLATVDAMLMDSMGPELPAATHLAEVDLDNPPQDCPHCGGRLSWGTGPHVADAALRPSVRAWECPSCRAAGLLSTGA